MGLDGDDVAALVPDLLEQAGEQLASLGGIGFDLPEPGEVCEHRGGPIELRRGWWSGALEFFFEGLAAHNVLALGEVAHYVEVLEAFELAGDLSTADTVLAAGAACVGDFVGHECLKLLVGLEAAQPVDELGFEWFGFDDRLAARVPVPAG